MNPTTCERRAYRRLPRLLTAATVALALGGCSGGGEETATDGNGTAQPPARPAVETAASPAERPPAAPEPPAVVPPPAEPEVEPAATPPAAPAGDAGAIGPSAPPPAAATVTQHVIQGVVTQWRPMILFVQPGDQIVFRQMAGHDTESMEGLTPEGAEHWKSKLGEEGFSITLDVPGAYIYKCNPHVSTGMVAAIVVGDVPPANLGQLEQSPQNKGMIGRAIRKLNQAIEAL